MSGVDAELAGRLESLGRGVNSALDHFMEIVIARVEAIRESAPNIVLVQSLPEEWTCTKCGTGMIRRGDVYVFIHICEGVSGAEENV